MASTTTKTTTGSQSYKVHDELGSNIYGPHIGSGNKDEYVVYDDNAKEISTHKDLTEAKRALSKHLIDTGHQPLEEDDPLKSLRSLFGK